MAKTTAKPPRTARLTLTIAGVDYILHRLGTHELPPRTTLGWKLTRDDPKLGRITHLITAGALSGRACDCQAFRFKGQADECKHLAAARVCKLL